ncbi:MAG: helix-turn-helix transcriptional regulator [Oscillospiraceae bacterium]|nr:helix-turn-helix transcriptional regulator [Oscillospiraceae bacterium]
MNNQTLGSMIATLRKEHNMTQLQLAEKMGVTDKAVSKWERDLSCPDVASLPRLAELFGITVDEMLQVKETTRSQPAENKTEKIMDIVLKAVPLAMGVTLVVSSALGSIDVYSGFTMTGIALFCMALKFFSDKKE